MEDEKLIGPLLARAQWSLLRRETRREQQERVAASPECHTRAFADLLLAELGAAGSRDEAEFIAHLALRVAEGMDEHASLTQDFLARVWIEVANVRRIAAEWSPAQAALRRADEHLARGSGDILLKGRARSVAASLSGDQGHRAQAVGLLEECLKLYEAQKAWPLVGRTLVKTAHTLVDSDPERALALTDQALPLIPAENTVLRWLAESNRVECLIEMGEIGQALQAFHLTESLRAAHARADAARRSNFTAARLLEALGHIGEAEQLFEAVIADAFDHEAYREAFLDLLYLF
jgi:tetratricopeptide (TPR) repeat protein